MAIGAHDQQVDGLAVDDVGNYRVGLAGDDIRMGLDAASGQDCQGISLLLLCLCG